MSKVSKEHEPWLVDDSSGALFTMPNNDEFQRCLDASSPPFVLMQPVDDLQAGHALVQCILEHKVATLIRSLRLGYVGKLLTDERLLDEYNRLKLDLETWAWPQTTNRDHGAKMHEVRNRTAYVPPERSIVAPLWVSFAKNLNVGTESLEDDPSKERLPVFRGFDDKADADASKAGIPRLRSTSPTTVLDIAALCDATRAIEFEVERQRKNAARSTPVSPHPSPAKAINRIVSLPALRPTLSLEEGKCHVTLKLQLWTLRRGFAAHPLISLYHYHSNESKSLVSRGKGQAPLDIF